MPRGLTTGMIYIPLDVRWPRSKKVRAMIVAHGQEGMAAWALYLAMACYCREGLTDGFVPAAEVGALAYPLPPDQADGLLKLLLGYRLVADSPGHNPGNSPGHNPGNSDGYSGGYSPGYVVRGYLKRNGSRANAEQLAAKLADAGRKGMETRWSAAPDNPGNNQGHNGGLRPVLNQTETETKTPARAPAPARAGTREDWTPHSALDPKPARRGTRRPGPVHPPAQEVLADTHRSGGPTADVTAWAAKARAGITQPEEDTTGPPPPDQPEPAPQDPPEPDAEPEETDPDDIPF